MTGYELLKKIKESSTFREIPVVIMLSENVLARIDRCLEEGAEEFIVKPVKLADVKRLKDSMIREVRDRVQNREKGTGINKRKHPDSSDDLSSSSPSITSSPSSSSSPSSVSPSEPCSPSTLDSPTGPLKITNSDRAHGIAGSHGVPSSPARRRQPWRSLLTSCGCFWSGTGGTGAVAGTRG